MGGVGITTGMNKVLALAAKAKAKVKPEATTRGDSGGVSKRGRSKPSGDLDAARKKIAK